MEEDHRALSNYNYWAFHSIVSPRRLKHQSLSSEEKSLLPWFEPHIDFLSHCVEKNSLFLSEIGSVISEDWHVADSSTWAPCTGQDLDKVRATLLQLSREWSEEGMEEREISMGRILAECEELFPDVLERPHVRILVPGAGLGRLVIEFVKRGFQCQGNEFSYQMLLVSSFILNRAYCANYYQIFPFIHKFSHVSSRNNQIRPVYIPDFNPSDVSQITDKFPSIDAGELMSMAAGSFVDLYGPQDISLSETYSSDPSAEAFRQANAGYWDVVATCFFLDTASNIIEYLKTIKNALKKGGKWINFGPLLWHFEDDENVDYVQRKNSPDEPPQGVPTPLRGMELTRADLVELIENMGFRFIKHESDIDSAYCSDKKSLGGFTYKCEFWVCESV